MQSELEGMVWVLSRPVDGVIRPDHPDYEYWTEADEIERWIDAGAPTPDPPQTASPDETEHVPIHLQLAVTKENAGKMLGGKSVDWIEKYVLPYVKTIQPSRSVLIPSDELQRWVNENASFALGR